jgi:hypothetical protein
MLALLQLLAAANLAVATCCKEKHSRTGVVDHRYRQYAHVLSVLLVSKQAGCVVAICLLWVLACTSVDAARHLEG